VRILSCDSHDGKFILRCIQLSPVSGCESPQCILRGTVVRWLQSIDHHIRSASWSEVCSWIHGRFGRDQHEYLIRQLFHIKQSASV
jgi:hypothetical protein